MRILLLEQFFDPEPTIKGIVFAKKLVERGHQVEVLTGFPNYPGGKVYPGYRIKLKQIESWDGIRVIRVPLYPSHDRSGIRRIFNYSSFTLAAAFIGPRIIKRPDVIYCYHPPGTIGGAAVVLSRLMQCPFVYDIQDIWPDSVAVSGMMQSNLGLGILNRWCNWIYGMAGHITVLSPGFKTLLIRRGVTENKISVIYNWADEDKLKPMARNEVEAVSLGMSDKFNITFAGTMGVGQALETVLDAAALLLHQASNLQFVFVGGGTEKERLQTLARARALSNVLFLPRHDPEKMPSLYSQSDVLLVHLRDDPLYQITIPSKTQTYMAMGKPILMAVRGDAADLVLRSRSGIICPPQDPQSLADAALQLFHTLPKERLAMGYRGQDFYKRELSLDSGVQRFEEIFVNLMADSKGRRFASDDSSFSRAQ